MTLISQYKNKLIKKYKSFNNIFFTKYEAKY